MTLQEIIDRVREFLVEPVTLVEARNVTDTFENYTANATIGLPWVSTGATPPKVQTVNAQKMLCIEAVACSGTAGIDISGQSCSTDNPVVVSFVLRRTADDASEVIVFGINNDDVLASSDAFALLKFSGATTHFFANTVDGWIELSDYTVSKDTDYTIEAHLYSDRWSLYINDSPISLIQGRSYPGGYTDTNHGYLYFPGTSDATGTAYINDLNSTGRPAVVGETQWTNAELGEYANEACKWLRQVLSDSVLLSLRSISTQTLTASDADYTLPTGWQRIFGARANGYPVNFIQQAQAGRYQHYINNHSAGTAALQKFPTGWIVGNTLYLCPTPSSTVASGLEIDYLPAYTDMDVYTPSTETPELPSDLHFLIVHYVCMKAREKYNEDASSLRATMESAILSISNKTFGDASSASRQNPAMAVPAAQ